MADLYYVVGIDRPRPNVENGSRIIFNLGTRLSGLEYITLRRLSREQAQRLRPIEAEIARTYREIIDKERDSIGESDSSAAHDSSRDRELESFVQSAYSLLKGLGEQITEVLGSPDARNTIYASAPPDTYRIGEMLSRLGNLKPVQHHEWVPMELKR